MKRESVKSADLTQSTKNAKSTKSKRPKINTKSTKSSIAKVKESYKIADEIKFVKLWMNFMDKSLMSQRFRLKSSASVLRAMKKFSRVINISFMNLGFFWCGKQLTGTEIASRMEGAEIMVERRLQE